MTERQQKILESIVDAVGQLWSCGMNTAKIASYLRYREWIVAAALNRWRERQRVRMGAAG